MESLETASQAYCYFAYWGLENRTLALIFTE